MLTRKTAYARILKIQVKNCSYKLLAICEEQKMSLQEKPQHIFEPDPLQCGQAVLAMLTGKTVEEIIELCGTERETTLADMKRVLNLCGINMSDERIAVKYREDLPEIAVLSLETPKCWHWSLYFKGKFLDPEYGVLEDFPPSNRRYYWKIKE